MSASGAPINPEGSRLHDKKLVSWKEIAVHLGREIRTVQRWEKTESLPVRRHEHQKRSTVYAFASELDDWFKKRQPADDPEADAAFEPEPDVADLSPESDNGNANLATQAPAILAENDSAVSRANVTPPPPKWKVGIVLAAAAVILIAAYAVLRWVRPGALTQQKVRLVVMPFTNLSGDPKQDYLSAGLTEVLTTQLGRLDPENLRVIAPTSAKVMSGRPIAEIREKLDVQYVLEGSVQPVAKQVRIDIRLIQASDEAQAGSDSFTRDLSDFLQVESDVAEAVAHKLLATLPGESPPAPSRAEVTIKPVTAEARGRSNDTFLKAESLWASRKDIKGSIALFEQAIADNPNNAQAYAGLANATAIIGQVPNDGLKPQDAKPKARDAAQRALQLDPRLVEAHAVLGNVAMGYDWDFAAAEKELQAAINLNPSYSTAHEWYAHLLIVEGRNAEALAEARRASHLDPVAPLFHSVLAETYYYGGNYEAAIAEAQQVVKAHPDFLLAYFWLGSAYREMKMYPQAIDTFSRARQMSGDFPVTLMAYGHAQAVAGNAQEARSALHTLEQLRNTRYIPDLYLAAIHVALGEKDEAFRLLDSAFEERVDRLVYLNVDPMADPLRSDPRFAQLLHKIGLR